VNNKTKILIGFFAVLIFAHQAISGSLDNWTKQIPSGVPDTGYTFTIYAATYGNGRFLAAGTMGLNGVILTSTDGVNWSGQYRDYPGLHSATFGNGIFIVGGGNLNDNDVIMTSSDGITWATNTIVGRSGVRSIAHGNGRYVAVGEMGSIYTSSDAALWTNSTAVDGSKVHLGVTFGASKFVVVGIEVQGLTFKNGLILASIDGITFTAVARPPQNVGAVAYGNGRFVAVGGGAILTSTNGNDWVTQSSGWTIGTPEAICYANGTFVAVTDSPGALALSSFDGITWDERHLIPNNGLHGITFGAGAFVTVGNGGTILQSGFACFHGRSSRATGGVHIQPDGAQLPEIDWPSIGAGCTRSFPGAFIFYASDWSCPAPGHPPGHPQPQGAVGAHAGENDADAMFLLVLRQGAEEEINWQAQSARGCRFEQMQDPAQDGHVLVRRVRWKSPSGERCIPNQSLC
jgi:hypothetical protein